MKRIAVSLLLVCAFVLSAGVASKQAGIFPVQAATTYQPRNGDPCALNIRQSALVNLAASGRVITGVAGKYTFVCHIGIVSATAQNIALVEGTGSTCGTGTAGMAGGATAATGWNLGVNGSVFAGTGGSFVNATATSGDDVCLLLSSTGQTSGVIQYVQQ